MKMDMVAMIYFDVIDRVSKRTPDGAILDECFARNQKNFVENRGTTHTSDVRALDPGVNWGDNHGPLSANRQNLIKNAIQLAMRKLRESRVTFRLLPLK